MRYRKLRGVRALPFAGAVALAQLCAGRADAADARAQETLESAEQALVNLDYETANRSAASLADQRGLSHDQLVRVYRVLALTDAILDKEPAAREAFERLLAYDPSYAADPNLGPKVQAPFLEARGFMRAQAVQPGLDVSVALRASDGGTIRVTARDPLHVARRAVVGFRWSAEPGFTTIEVPLTPDAPATVPPPPLGTTRLDYYVQVYDERDDAFFEAGNPIAPKSATIELPPVMPLPLASPPRLESVAPPPPAHPAAHPSIFASPIFWAIAGVVVVGAGTGAYFAAHGSSSGGAPAATGVVLTPSAQCGYPASSACR